MLYFVDKRDKYGGIPNIQISHDLRAFAKFVVKSVPAQQKFAVFFVKTRWRPVADARNRPVQAKIQVHRILAYNLLYYRTDPAIQKFAHSHLPFGFGRL